MSLGEESSIFGGFHGSTPQKQDVNNKKKNKVLQVERRDYPELAPTNRPRSQSMDGFDDIYTDIVDYIVRCTHKIWDERDIGLIYTHYTHNFVPTAPRARSTIARMSSATPSSGSCPSPSAAAWPRR